MGKRGVNPHAWSIESRKRLSDTWKRIGHPCGNKGKKHSEETKRKISESERGRVFTDEHKKKISLALKGRTFDNEWKLKQHLSHLGQVSGMKGKRHTEETKRILREKRLRQKFPTEDTSIEKILFNILDHLHIKYSKHKSVDCVCQADAVVDTQGYKVAIFADGCYWHGCQLHFSDNISRQLRDENNNRIMAFNGWLVLRFWEHDLLKRPSGVLETLRSSIVCKVIEK